VNGWTSWGSACTKRHPWGPSLCCPLRSNKSQSHGVPRRRRRCRSTRGAAVRSLIAGDLNYCKAMKRVLLSTAQPGSEARSPAQSPVPVPRQRPAGINDSPARTPYPGGAGGDGDGDGPVLSCWATGTWSDLANRNQKQVGGLERLLVCYQIVNLALFSSQKFSRFPVISNLAANTWSIKYIWKQKLFAQFICKPRDESFETSYSIIEQCLSNKNESATVSFFKGFCKLNKAFVAVAYVEYGSASGFYSFFFHSWRGWWVAGLAPSRNGKLVVRVFDVTVQR